MVINFFIISHGSYMPIFTWRTRSNLVLFLTFCSFFLLLSKEENEFLVHSLLWIGFFGETYTGLVKDTPDGEWAWPENSVR